MLFHLSFDTDVFDIICKTILKLNADNQAPEMIIVTLHHDEGDNKKDITPTTEGAR